MLKKSQAIQIPLSQFVTPTTKFFFFKGENSYDDSVIRNIEELCNITSEIRDVTSIKFLIENPETSITTTETTVTDGFDMVTTCLITIEGEYMHIEITYDVDVRSNGIRDERVFKNVVAEVSSKVEQRLNNNLSTAISFSPRAKPVYGIRSSFTTNARSEYRHPDSYNRYRDDSDFWDYYLMYALFSDDDYNDYDEFDFYDGDDILAPSVMMDMDYDMDVRVEHTDMDETQSFENESTFANPETYFEEQPTDDIVDDVMEVQDDYNVSSDDSPAAAFADDTNDVEDSSSSESSFDSDDGYEDSQDSDQS